MTMMECGHAANATNQDTGAPVCVICFMGRPNDKATTVAAAVDLTGRRARCSSNRGDGCNGRYKCGDCDRDSDPTALAFFEHRPGEEFDRYYCGCMGWD